MADFNEHVNQANKNISFLQEIDSLSDCWDWKVTVSFYSAVHIINAHLAKFDLHYRSHHDTEDALNPFNLLSATKIDEEEYVAYKSLNNLSRRSRYLCSENKSNKSVSKHITFDKHFSKSIKKLDKLLIYFSKKYKLDIPSVEITCFELKESDNLRYFSLLKKQVS